MLSELTLKEVKNMLRDKKIIITAVVMPLVIFAIMGVIYGFVFSTATREAVRKVQEASVLICNLDSGPFSKLVIEFSRETYGNLTVKESCNLPEELELLESGKYSLIAIIPEDFSESIESLKPPEVTLYTYVRGISMTSLAATGVVNSFVEGLESIIKAYVVSEEGLDPRFVESPVVPNATVLFRGKPVDPAVLGGLAFSSFILVFAPLAVISTALGISSSSMASENEEKTLEVLLTLPIPRIKLVFSKLLGSLVVVVISAASFMVGWFIYLNSIMGVMSGAFAFENSSTAGGSNLSAAPALEVLLDPTLGASLGAGVFLALFSVTCLGILLGSIAPDVRTSQTYIGQLSFFIILPGFVLAFLDFSSLPPVATYVLTALSPFIAPIVVFKAWLEGLNHLIPVALAWSATFSVIMLYAASKLLDSERLLTLQFRLLVRRLGRRGRASVWRR